MVVYKTAVCMGVVVPEVLSPIIPENVKGFVLYLTLPAS